MAKMMTQIDLLSKYVIGGRTNLVKVVGTNTRQCPDDTKFEVLYNEEVQYLENQVGGSHNNYQRRGGNQEWKEYRDSGWKDWRAVNWRDREVDKDRYVPPHDRPPQKIQLV
ncbi:hypothetical protein MTR67_018494 [Solanum verrucosum]|uniref:Uncharacterized protein n=1 Tax=Solanum verrucosum TaxID=315347 RepID=A0AAF0QJT1_SOLVR|nr:hypothetical protein MTR67_018494 [Solanum verrucosum]